ncbi:MAG: di-heme oxidoredictase family protein [Pseudomonadota bacterium]
MRGGAITATIAAVISAACIALACTATARDRAGPDLTHRTDLDPETIARLEAILAAPLDASRPQPFEAMSGGATTTRVTPDANAFSKPSANLTPEQQADFAVGNGVFRKLWTPAPSSTTASDGLGPLWNARACQRCHIKDGRGHPPPPGRYWEEGGDAVSFVLGLSVPAEAGQARTPQTLSERVVPDPALGAQLHDFAAPGLAREGRPVVTYEEIAIALSGGEAASLRRPTYTIEGAGSLHPELMISPRVANPMIGLGLLEAIHERDILTKADPDDADGDGISGRAQVATDAPTGVPLLGRFGWKAAQPSVRQQSAFAFVTDMGLSTSLVPTPYGDCMPAQSECLAAPTGVGGELPGTPAQAHEVPDALLELVAFYAANLAVPRRRNEDDRHVLRGRTVFHESGCAMCHRPNYLTRDDDTVPLEHRRQLIWPYTDLLLHDMGEGLADGRPQGVASGREWRTPPLWGVGLTEQVSGHTQFLHDGRARNLLEAILWHGGEAAPARDAVIALEPEDRRALIRFLESL